MDYKTIKLTIIYLICLVIFINF